MMTRDFGMATGCTGLAIILNVSPKSGPHILLSDKVNSLVLSEVSCEYMIMLVPENAQMKVIYIQNIDMIIFTEESFRVDRPS